VTEQLPSRETLTPEDAKLLLQLCRSGKLYEIEEWIASGKSLQLKEHLASHSWHLARLKLSTEQAK